MIRKSQTIKQLFAAEILLPKLPHEIYALFYFVLAIGQIVYKAIGPVFYPLEGSISITPDPLGCSMLGLHSKMNHFNANCMIPYCVIYYTAQVSSNQLRRI